MITLMSNPDPEDNMIAILKIIAKKTGLFVATNSTIKVTPAQSIPMRNHMRNLTNSLYRLKEALEAFSLVFNNALLPSNIRKHVLSMEK